jgi:hypothetical protein
MLIIVNKALYTAPSEEGRRLLESYGSRGLRSSHLAFKQHRS